MQLRIISEMIFLNIILVALICVVIYYLISYHRHNLSLVKAANALPGPKTLPLIGNGLYFLQCNSDERVQKGLMLTNIYPSPFRIWMGNKMFVAIADPDHARIVLHSRICLRKSTVYKFMEPIFGKGLFTASESTWAIHRKMITPSFSTNILKSFFNTFVAQSLKLVNDLANVGLNGNEIELLHYLHKCHLVTILDNAMDLKLDSSSDKTQYIVALMRFKKNFTQRLQNPLLYPDTIFNLTALGREIQEDLKFLNSIAHEIMQEKIYSVKKLDATRNKSEISPGKKFIDILVDAFHNGYSGRRLKQKEVLDEINTMLIGGSDTTSITMNFVIFMLANFPEIQEKVYQELFKFYGTEISKSSLIKYEDLQHMNYLDRVIKETMRLFPIAPVIARYVTEDFKLDTEDGILNISGQISTNSSKDVLINYITEYISGQYTLPKGAEIVVAILALHRDEKYWPNPLTFDPDRFLPENIAKRHPYCYIPFSSGPRNCIGMRYGIMSLKVMISILVRTFVFKVDKRITIDEIKLDMNFDIDTSEPLKVKIEKRNF